jgi:hypothetical protein
MTETGQPKSLAQVRRFGKNTGLKTRHYMKGQNLKPKSRSEIGVPGKSRTQGEACASADYQGTWGMAPRRIRAAASMAKRTAQVSRDSLGTRLAMALEVWSGIWFLRDYEIERPWKFSGANCWSQSEAEAAAAE